MRAQMEQGIQLLTSKGVRQFMAEEIVRRTGPDLLEKAITWTKRSWKKTCSQVKKDLKANAYVNDTSMAHNRSFIQITLLRILEEHGMNSSSLEELKSNLGKNGLMLPSRKIDECQRIIAGARILALYIPW